jgi:hypothetical protein
MTTSTPVAPLATAEPPAANHRVLAMLRAVAAGRAQVTCSAEPDLFVDGVPCCDQFTAHALAHEGLVRPGQPCSIGQRVPAVLTRAGRALVTGAQAAA